jgi:hypothetical protein
MPSVVHKHPMAGKTLARKHAFHKSAIRVLSLATEMDNHIVDKPDNPYMDNPCPSHEPYQTVNMDDSRRMGNPYPTV